MISSISRTDVSTKINALWDHWKKALDWKEGTGNGLLEAADGVEAREVAESDVMGTQSTPFFLCSVYLSLPLTDVFIAQVYRLCSSWDGVDPIFRDRDGGTAELRADSTQLHNPILDAFLPSPTLPNEQSTQINYGNSLDNEIELSHMPSPTESEQQD